MDREEDSGPESLLAASPGAGGAIQARRNHRLHDVVLWVVDTAAVVTGIGIPVWLLVTDALGERFPLTAVTAFMPGMVWAVPLFAAGGAAALFRRRRSAVLCGMALVFVCLFYMDFEIPRFRLRTPPGPRVMIVTNNTGQNGGTSPAEFIRRADPDVIVFQERQFFPGVPPARGWNRVLMGEFALWSRLPVISREAVMVPCSLGKKGTWRAAIRVVLELETGDRIAVYNVHLPSPRRGIELLRGKGFLRSTLKGGGLLSFRRWRRFHEWNLARLETARRFREVLQREKLPWIAAGDFNMPDHGAQYRLFRRWQDAFEIAGVGYGYTFPGSARHWPFGPWLRLDYVFASREWAALKAGVEKRRPSQHRAVAVELVLIRSGRRNGQ